MLKIGIICAGDRELEPFLQHIENCRISEKAMLKIYEGTVNGINNNDCDSFASLYFLKTTNISSAKSGLISTLLLTSVI